MTNEKKIKTILDSLNELQEELLALPDDMLLSIDPRDNASIDDGAAFMKSYNDQLADFSTCVVSISELLKSFFVVDPEKEDEESSVGESKSRDRIVQELDRTEAHGLDEHYTFKRPYGFILKDRAFKGLKTWKNLYLHTLVYLYETDPNRFASIAHDKRFTSRRNNPAFAQESSSLRVAAPIPGGLFAEVNLSANHIIRNIKVLLKTFDIPRETMKIYLREDRDAAVEKHP